MNGTLRRAKAGISSALGLLLIAGFTATSVYSVADDGALKIDGVDLPGATGGVNNIQFLFDRYALVAPFSPSVEITDETELGDLDNNFIYLIDTRKPTPKEGELARLELGNCYFPTRLIVDEATGTIFVRGTKYVAFGEGEYEPVEAIAIARVSINDKGEPGFDPSVGVFEVRGGETGYTDEAPPDIAFGVRGKNLVFTNGSTVFLFDITHGYIYPVYFLSAKDYGPNNKISNVTVDEETRTLTVVVSRREFDEGGNRTDYSDLYFYRINDNATIDLRKRVLAYEFPEGDFVAPGSNVAIVPEKGAESACEKSLSVFLVTAQGWLNQISIDCAGLEGVVNRVQFFPELAQAEGEALTPRLIQYDRASKLLSIVKRGHLLEIRRPVYERPGKIRRPVYAHLFESPTLVLAKLNKKGKVLETRAFVDELAESGGLTGVIVASDGQAYASTYNGDLLAIDLSAGVANAGLSALGAIGEGVDEISYLASRSSFVTINSATVEEGEELETRDRVTVVKLRSASETASIVQALLPPVSLAGALARDMVLSIRRPCNVRNR